MPAIDDRTDLTLRDGSTVGLRPVAPDDIGRLRAFLEGLSPDSRLLRFFSAGIDIERTAHWAAHPEEAGGYALVATTGPDDRIVAHGCFERDTAHPDHAEVALAVGDHHQDRGLGTLLLGHLAHAADARGVATFTAHVLPQNHQMLQVLRDIGFPVTRRAVPGDIEISLPTALTVEARERFEWREQLAAEAAVRHVLAPRSVAVVGASRRRGTPGGEVFHNLLSGGFAGPVYPVHAHAEVVQSVLAYKSVRDVPAPVDLAVIVVPARAVVDVARDCADAGVRALVVLSAGFAEMGGDGVARQRELLQVCRQAGMRLVGPNSIGVVNTDPSVNLNAQFGPHPPAAGRVGFLSQSGALGIAIIDRANALGLGLTSFVSVGNKADLSGNDLLNYWEGDEHTEVVLLYLESFGNPRKFSRIARRVGRTKPIVAVKSGRTAAGASAASSHTGALLRTSDRTVDALFRQAGVVRTDTLSELFDVATMLANQPVPTGRRIGIVTNAGGPGILCADACAGDDLDVVALSDATQRALRRILPAEAATRNPVDTLAAVTPEHLRQAIALVGRSGEVDAVIAIYIPPLAGDPAAVRRAVRAAAEDLRGHVPMALVFMAAANGPGEVLGDGCVLPTYQFPEDAVRALGRAVAYGTWRAEPHEAPAEPSGVDHDRASAVLAGALAASDGQWLTPDEVVRLFDCYGIPLVSTQVVATAHEAAAVARRLGGPVALKAVAPGMVHKTDAHAVRLGLRTADEVVAAAAGIGDAVDAAGYTLTGYVVQPMVAGDVELIVGVTHDASFGPVVVCGAGGTAAELLKDIAVRIAPLTAGDAQAMLRSLATYPLLDGYRGAARADVPAVEDLLLRVSSLAEHQPTVVELDCNPVMVGADGAVVVDARVFVSRDADAAGGRS